MSDDFGGVSLKPSDAQAGGGLFDDVDVRIKKCYFRTWDYNGSIATPVLGLGVIYEHIGDEGEFEQVYSAGDLSKLVPSSDGTEAVPVNKDDRTGLPDSCNAIQFLMSLVNVGFPEAKIGKKVSVFEGMGIHANKVPQLKRAGIKNQDPNKKNDILVATKLLFMPGEEPGGTTTKAKKAAAPKTSAASGAPVQAGQQAAAPAAAAAPGGAVADDAVTNRAVAVVLQILAAKGGTVAKAQIAGEAFAILNAAQDPLRNAVSQLVFKDAFLANGPWAFDGTTISNG